MTVANVNRARTGSPRALVLYLRVVLAAGALAVFASTLTAVGTPHPLWWLGLAGLAIVTGSFRVNFASISADIAIDDTFFITTAILFGPGPGTLAIAASGLILSTRRRKPIRQIAFNAASLAVSMWIAAHAFFAIAGVPPLIEAIPHLSGLVVPLLALTIVYFLLNSGLTAVAVGLDTGQSPFQIWRDHFQWVSISYLAAASVAFCLVLLVQQASFMAMVVILPLFAVFHLTIRSSFGRVEDARRHLIDMDRLYVSTVETLAMAIDAKDDVTHSHVRRVQAYATGLARELGIADELTLKAIEAAALLHDTGKLAVPEHILNKPGKLTAAEFEKMKLHVDVGADILSLVNFPFPVEPIVRCHHENWDGSGYPRGVSGEAIPIGARILSVVDCFDALTSDRPYRARMTDEAALDILRERSGRMYDPRVVDTFIRVYRDIPIAVGETTEQRDVMQRIAQSRNDVDTADPPPDLADSAPSSLLAFVSLSRVVAGEGGLEDVLALSSKLITDVMPGASGAWYLSETGTDRLAAVETFGPAASVLRGASMDVGDRLTGWVAASRQPIVNSDAALDLGPRAQAVNPPLRACMSIPITAGPSLVAVLSLYSDVPDAFTGDQRRLVQMVAPHLGGAIRAARAAAPPHQLGSMDKSREFRLVANR
ncbi:MAG TPA: HD domain-containing phosphohydrolase [Vicinamibacterales bacterium]